MNRLDKCTTPTLYINAPLPPPPQRNLILTIFWCNDVDMTVDKFCLSTFFEKNTFLIAIFDYFKK